MSKYKVRFVWLCVLLFPVVAYFIVSLLSTEKQERQRQQLENKLTTAVEKKRGVSADEQVIIRLKDLTDFQWDRVYVFTPYTPVETIDKALGFAWPQAREIGINMLDHFNLLVFTNKGKVVNYLKHPLHLGDFSRSMMEQMHKGFNTDEAIFEVEIKDSSGEARLILRPQNESLTSLPKQ